MGLKLPCAKPCEVTKASHSFFLASRLVLHSRLTRSMDERPHHRQPHRLISNAFGDCLILIKAEEPPAFPASLLGQTHDLGNHKRLNFEYLLTASLRCWRVDGIWTHGRGPVMGFFSAAHTRGISQLHQSPRIKTMRRMTP
jgi:hypothetical protein